MSNLLKLLQPKEYKSKIKLFCHETKLEIKKYSDSLAQEENKCYISRIEIKEKINMERKINKHEDAVAIYFKVGFIDEDMYSLTVDTAYGDAFARIVEKKELDEFLKDW